MNRHRRHVRGIAFALSLLVASARAQSDATVALNFQDVEISVLAKFISEVTGRNFIVDDRVRGKVTIIAPTRITPEEAFAVFQSVLQVKGFTAISAGAFTKVMPVRDARETAAGSGDQLVTRIVPVKYADAEKLIPTLQPVVSKDGVLTAYPGTNRLVVVDTAANVERVAALVRGLDMPSAPAAPSARIHSYRLQYADADQLLRVLSQLLGLPQPPAVKEHARGSSLTRRAARGRGDDGVGYDGASGAPAAPPPLQPVSTAGAAATIPLGAAVRLTADPATNTLLINATNADWEVLRGVIRDLDVRRRQVFVEAIILEATADKTRALGIELQGAGALGGAFALGQANLGALPGAASDPLSLPGLLLAAASRQTVRLPSGQEVPAQTALVTALQTDTDLNVLSAPNMVTTDNEEAEIIVGRNVPFVASRATSSSNLTNLFTTIERHDVGITLRITPQITGDDYVRLTLFEEVSDLDTQTADAGDPAQVGPTTTVRSTSTVIAARDGQTVVIGGLLADRLRNADRKVPFLSEIPVLGNLFKKTDDRRVKTNLLVFLTPHVIGSDTQMAENSLRERDRMPRHLRRNPVMRDQAWEPPPATTEDQ